MKEYFKHMIWTIFLITVSTIGGRILTDKFYTIHEVSVIELDNGEKELVYIDNYMVRIGAHVIYYHSHKNIYTNKDSLVFYDKKEKILSLLNKTNKINYEVKNEKNL